MALDIEAMQNAEPTNWGTLDQQLSERSSGGRFSQDHTLHVRFFMKTCKNDERSVAENRPIYEEVEYVEIMMPGEKNSMIVRPAASMRDDLRFKTQYQQFKEGHKEQTSGTTLRALPFLSEAQIEELAFFKVRTVEQLAGLADSVQFMGVQELKNRAREWVKAQTDGVKLARENTEMRERMKQLEKMLEQATAPQGNRKKQDDILS